MSSNRRVASALLLLCGLLTPTQAGEDEGRRAEIVQAHLRHAWSLADGEDALAALPWFVRALEVAEGDPVLEDGCRRALFGMLSRTSELRQVILADGLHPEALYWPTDRVFVAYAGGRLRAWDLRRPRSVDLGPARSPTARPEQLGTWYEADRRGATLDVSPDGRTLTALLDLWRFELVKPLPRGLVHVRSIEADGHVWAGPDGELYVYDPPRPLESEAGGLRAVPLPEGSRVVTVRNDLRFWLLRTEDGLAVFDRKHPDRAPRAIATESPRRVTTHLHPHRPLLYLVWGRENAFTGTFQGSLEIWNVETGELVQRRVLAEKIDLESATFSRDGRWVHANRSVLECETLTPVSWAPDVVGRAVFEFGPTDAVAALHGPEGLRLVEARTGRVLSRAPPGTWPIRFMEHGRLLVRDETGIEKLLAPATGEIIAGTEEPDWLLPRPSRRPGEGRPTPLLSDTTVPARGCGLARLARTRDGLVCQVFSEFASESWPVGPLGGEIRRAVGAGGRLVAANVVGLVEWGPPDPRIMRKPVDGFDLSPDGRWAVARTSDSPGSLLWRDLDGEREDPAAGELADLPDVTHFTCGTGDRPRVVVIGADRSARVLSLTDGKPVGEPWTIAENRRAWAQISPDGEVVGTLEAEEFGPRVFIAFRDATGRLLRPEIPFPRTLVVGFGPRGPSYLTFPADGRHAIVHLGSTLRAYRRPTLELVWERTLDREIHSVDVSRNSREILVLTRLGARRFSVAAGTSRGPFLPLGDHPLGTSIARFGPEGEIVLGTLDGVRRWDARFGVPLSHDITPPEGVETATYAPRGESLLVLDRDGHVLQAPVGVEKRSVEDLRALARLISLRQLVEQDGVRWLEPATREQLEAAKKRLGIGP
jgi:hypothetical protein